MTEKKETMLKKVANVVGLIVLCGGAAAATLAWLGTFVYATQAQVTDLEIAHVRDQGKVALQEYRLEKVEVDVSNVKSIAQRTDANVELLLKQRRIEPAPMPVMRAAPPPPSKDPPSQ